MGNYGSCCHCDKFDSETSTLIDNNGKLRRFQLPITAAELMLEQPGHVVSPVDDLRKSRRIVALRSDDELLSGKSYVLIPVSKVNSVVSELKMAMIESSFRRSLFRQSNSKVMPAEATAALESENDGVRDFGGDSDTGFVGHKLGKCRPWKPVLEPIFEGQLLH